jgi:peptidoglycan hydrolase CwlO-like protein
VKGDFVMVKNENQVVKKKSLMDKLSLKIIKWVGTPQSLIVHTILFIAIPSLSLFGLDFRAVSLLLTTWLSMEAIYLAIFIQMTVNRQGESIEDIEEDIEDIQEDVEDLTEDFEDISEDIDKFTTDEKKSDSPQATTEGRIEKILKSLPHPHLK